MRARLRNLMNRLRYARDPTSYWNARAKTLGTVGAVNVANSDVEAFTREQTAFLFPLLRPLLTGDERLVLDFGCGAGRFCPALRELTGAEVVGVDVAADFIQLAPRVEGVRYDLLVNGDIPLPDDSVDLAWVFAVLAALIDDADLQHACDELRRVMKPGAAMLFVENTEPRADLFYYRFRRPQEYVDRLSFAGLRPVDEFIDRGERMTVMVGRVPE
jgi:SAM-dependent methyltransferase